LKNKQNPKRSERRREHGEKKKLFLRTRRRCGTLCCLCSESQPLIFAIEFLLLAKMQLQHCGQVYGSDR
jgi:hypothetical protein